MTAVQEGVQMHGERPNRLDLRRPYLFTFLIVALVLAVTGTSGAAARSSGLPGRLEERA